MAYYRSSGSNSSRTNFPVGAVKQTTSHEYHGGNSDALTGTSSLTRVESGSDANLAHMELAVEGNITLDSSQDIYLDADGGDIIFYDNGTNGLSFNSISIVGSSLFCR